MRVHHRCAHRVAAAKRAHADAAAAQPPHTIARALAVPLLIALARLVEALMTIRARQAEAGDTPTAPEDILSQIKKTP